MFENKRDGCSIGLLTFFFYSMSPVRCWQYRKARQADKKIGLRD